MDPTNLDIDTLASKRSMYKPERAPARKVGLRFAKLATLPDANSQEIAVALFVLGWMGGVVVGRGGEYDPYRDEFKVVGKSRYTGKAQDWTVQGEEVAAAIRATRIMANVSNLAPTGMHVTDKK